MFAFLKLNQHTVNGKNQWTNNEHIVLYIYSMTFKWLLNTRLKAENVFIFLVFKYIATLFLNPIL